MSHNAGELAGLQDLEVPTAEMRDMFGMAWSGLEHYAQMLAEEGQLRGLIGPRELPRLYSRHLVNSAAVVPFLPRHGSVADLGSGAGLPGVVVALSRPDLEVTLIEPMERRCAWLELVTEELDLDNVRVWRGRAEEMRAFRCGDRPGCGQPEQADPHGFPADRPRWRVASPEGGAGSARD